MLIYVTGSVPAVDEQSTGIRIKQNKFVHVRKQDIMPKRRKSKKIEFRKTELSNVKPRKVDSPLPSVRMLFHNKEQEKIYRSGEFDDRSVREFFTIPLVHMTPASALPGAGGSTAGATGAVGGGGGGPVPPASVPLQPPLPGTPDLFFELFLEDGGFIENRDLNGTDV